MVAIPHIRFPAVGEAQRNQLEGNRRCKGSQPCVGLAPGLPFLCQHNPDWDAPSENGSCTSAGSTKRMPALLILAHEGWGWGR